MTPKKLSPERPILVGYVALEEWADDFSDWSGYITGPSDPTGANLAWQEPIQMIEMRAFTALRVERDELSKMNSDGCDLLAKALERIEKLKAALGYYANINNWDETYHDEVDGLEGDIGDRIDPDDIEYREDTCGELCLATAGKTARVAIAQDDADAKGMG